MAPFGCTLLLLITIHSIPDPPTGCLPLKVGQHLSMPRVKLGMFLQTTRAVRSSETTEQGNMLDTLPAPARGVDNNLALAGQATKMPGKLLGTESSLIASRRLAGLPA